MNRLWALISDKMRLIFKKENSHGGVDMNFIIAIIISLPSTLPRIPFVVNDGAVSSIPDLPYGALFNPSLLSTLSRGSILYKLSMYDTNWFMASMTSHSLFLSIPKRKLSAALHLKYTSKSPGIMPAAEMGIFPSGKQEHILAALMGSARWGKGSYGLALKLSEKIGGKWKNFLLKPEHVHESDLYIDVGTHYGHDHVDLGLSLRDLKLSGKGEVPFYEPRPFLRIGTAYHQAFIENLRVTFSFDLEHSLQGKREIRSFQLVTFEIYRPTGETGMGLILGFNNYGKDEIVFIPLIPTTFVKKNNLFSANLWGIQVVIAKRLTLQLTSGGDDTSFGAALRL